MLLHLVLLATVIKGHYPNGVDQDLLTLDNTDYLEKYRVFEAPSGSLV